MSLSLYFHLDTLLYRVIALVVAIAAHEFAHALAAYLLGDRTPRERGRLTLNPIAHIDFLGTAVVLFGPFGWGKPVPYDPARFRKPGSAANAVVICLAGPLANLALGVFLWWLYFNLPISGNDYDSAQAAWIVLSKGLLQFGFIVNLMLFMIHLLPFYPLDGWRILQSITPSRWAPAFLKYERLGFIPLIALLVTPYGQYVLQNAFSFVTRIIMHAY